QLFVPAAVEVVSIPPPVGEVGEPSSGDEAGLFAEKLSIGHFPAAGHEAPPFPQVLLLVASPPVEVSCVFLHGQTVHLVFEQGQETDLVDQINEVLPRLDTAGVIPVQSPHDPLSVFDGHCTAPLRCHYSTVVLWFLPRFTVGATQRILILKANKRQA